MLTRPSSGDEDVKENQTDPGATVSVEMFKHMVIGVNGSKSRSCGIGSFRRDWDRKG